MTDAAAPFDKSAYNRAAAECDLVAITLMKSTFEVQPEYFDRSLKRQLSYDSEVAGAGYLPEDKALSAQFKFSVQAKAGRKTLFKCATEYYVLYEAPSDLKEHEALVFCTRVGLFAAFPYFRSWVAQAAWAANANLPPVPNISSMPLASLPTMPAAS